MHVCCKSGSQTDEDNHNKMNAESGRQRQVKTSKEIYFGLCLSSTLQMTLHGPYCTFETVTDRGRQRN